MVEDSQIESILADATGAQAAADQLADAAIAAGGHDNVTTIVVDVEGQAARRERKLARKTKVTAGIVAALLALIAAGAVFAFNWWTNTVAYLGEVDGKVAIYQGVPGDIFGAQFSSLDEVTQVELDDLPPGVANRIRNLEVRCDSLEAARELVDEYEADISDADDESSADADSAADDSATDDDTAASSASQNANADPQSDQ